MKIKAYSYARFSTGQQMTGRSLARQQEAPEVQNFIRHHNLEVVKQMVDAGVSGFSGRNFSNSKALGQFVQQIRRGNIEKGSVLIVENLDRFSRDNITDCIARFTEIIKAGVSIGVVAMNIIIDLDQMNNNSMLWNYVSNEFQRARAESKRKSRFTNDIIQDKLNKAANGELVHFAAQSPSWIIGIQNKAGDKILKDTTDKSATDWILHEQRVETVKRIFSLYLSGESCNNIASIFNRESIPSLKNNKPGKWTQSNIKQILSNRNVIGWVKILDFEKDDYYKKIISPSVFEKVQIRLKFNSTTRGGAVDRVPNIFRGLIFCSCGGAIDVITNWSGKYNYAYCRHAFDGTNRCTCKTRVKMSTLEIAVFSKFRHPSQLTGMQSPKNELLEGLNNELATADMVISRFAEFLDDPELSDLPALKAKLKLAVASRETLIKKIEAEKSKIVQLAEMPNAVGNMFSLFNADKATVIINTQEWLNSFTLFMQELANRKELRNLMPSIFDRIVVSHKTEGSMVTTGINSTLISGSVINTILINNTRTRTYSIE